MILHTHWPAVTRQTSRAIPAKVQSLGGPPGHRPRTAAAKSHGAAARLSIASNAPPALAAMARPMCPRNSQAQAVVMPQAGQGR